MKIATWNVNGFRARAGQFSEWLARDQPDVVCLQELKAELSQIPMIPELDGYATYWHGLRAYSGVALHVRKGLLEAAPTFGHPDFDMESRIVHAEIGKLVLASVYVPNGGKDYEAKLQFLVRLAEWTRQPARGGARSVRARTGRPAGGRHPRAASGRSEHLQLVGALAQHAAAEHRLAH